MRIKAKARLRVTIDVDADSTWGDKTTINQVYEQARSDVEGFLRNNPQLNQRVRLFRVDEIVSVITAEEP
jgi:hypothetical protein